MNNYKYYVKVDAEGNLVNNGILTARAVAADLKMDYTDSFQVPSGYQEIVFQTENDVTLTKYQHLSDEITISKEDGKWYKKAIVVEGNDEYKAFVDGPCLQRALNERLVKLYESDWTQIGDAPLTEAQREEWRTYRTALRNITSDPAFPSHHKWPTPPTA